MISLPDQRPAAADLRSPGRFLLQLARRQWQTLLRGMLLGLIWTLSLAAAPAVLGHTVDAGLVRRNGTDLAIGTALLLGLAAVSAVSGVLRHRTSVWNWMLAAQRTAQSVGWHVADAGPAVADGATTGEVVATVASDAPRIADLFDVTARFAGAVVAYLVVAVLLIRIDPMLGALVLLGVPLLSASLSLVIRPLQSRQAASREQEGRLTALGADTVAGLRVLRGIGGEQWFASGYAARSRQVRQAGIAVAGPQATLDTAHVLLPGLFVVILTWAGARSALAGRITPGELVTLFGYAAYLEVPLSTATEALGKVVRGRVAAARVVRVLRLDDRTIEQSPTARPGPATGAGTVSDPASGVLLRPGELTAVVSGTTEEAIAIADRLGRFTPPPPDGQPVPLLDGVPVTDLPLRSLRSRIVVSEAEPRLFSGTVRDQLDPEHRHPDAAVLAAVRVADAGDVLAAVPGGLAGRLTERGRSLSGGQRQRLALARVLLADPEVLVLVEPTSAVDAHTEARIAERLRVARAGRSTLVTTTSPLLLDHVDRVLRLAGGRVVAEGSHRELLRTDPGYRDIVLRGED